MSLQILIEDQSLELGSNPKVSFELNSPAFDRENLRSSFTYPISAPDTPRNRRLLDVNGNYQNAKVFDVQKDAVLISNGIAAMRGSVVGKSRNYNVNTLEGKINIALTDDRGAFKLLVENKLLSDLTMNGSVSIGDDGIPPLPTVPADLTSKIFSQKTTDWANNIVTNGHDYFCFPTYYLITPTIHEGGTLTNYDERYCYVCNRYNNTTGLLQPVGVPGGITTVYSNVITPMYYYHQVIRHCFKDFGFDLVDEVGILDEADFKKLFLLSNYNILNGHLDFLSYNGGVGGSETLIYCEKATTFEAKNLLPDMSIYQFLNDFMMKFGCWFDIVGRVAYLRSFVSNAKATLAHKDIDPKIEEERVDNLGFIASYQVPSTPAFSDYSQDDYYLKYKEVDFESDIADEDNNTVCFVKSTGRIYRKKNATDNGDKFFNMYHYVFGKRNSNFAMPVVPLAMQKKELINPLTSDGEWSDSHPPPTDTDTAYVPVADGITNYNFTSRSRYIINGVSGYETEDYDTVPFASSVHEKVVAQMGFYFGVQTVYDCKYGYGTPHQYIPSDATLTKHSAFNLHLFGSDNIIDTCWGFVKKIFASKLKINVSINVDEGTILSHNWVFQNHIRGSDLYVAKIRGQFPLTKAVTYECYKIE